MINLCVHWYAVTAIGRLVTNYITNSQYIFRKFLIVVAVVVVAVVVVAVVVVIITVNINVIVEAFSESIIGDADALVPMIGSKSK